MFVIKMQSGRTIDWHVGEPAPVNGYMTNVACTDVAYVQADGDELTLILETFSNIPRTNRAVQRWSGAFAYFILDNLWL